MKIQRRKQEIERPLLLSLSNAGPSSWTITDTPRHYFSHHCKFSDNSLSRDWGLSEINFTYKQKCCEGSCSTREWQMQCTFVNKTDEVKAIKKRGDWSFFHKRRLALGYQLFLYRIPFLLFFYLTYDSHISHLLFPSTHAAWYSRSAHIYSHSFYAIAAIKKKDTHLKSFLQLSSPSSAEASAASSHSDVDDTAERDFSTPFDQSASPQTFSRTFFPRATKEPQLTFSKQFISALILRPPLLYNWCVIWQACIRSEESASL